MNIAELETIDAVVKLLQGASTDADGLHPVKLKNARVDEVVAGLTALDLADRVIALRNGNALVLIPGTEAQTRQVQKLVELYEKVDPETPPKASEKIGKVESKTVPPVKE